MQIKTQVLRIRGMNKDMSYSTFNPEYSFDNKNIRLTARDGNNLFSITNEKGNSEILFNDITPELTITVNTIGYSNLLYNSCMCTGYVFCTNMSKISSSGICYGTNSGVTMPGDHVDRNGNYSEFSSQLTGLAQDTTYYFKTFALIDGTYYYGLEMSFKTPLEMHLPTVIFRSQATNIVEHYPNNGTILHCSVVDDGNSNITERGICWSYSNQTPTKDNNVIIDSSIGVGNFDITKNGLVTHPDIIPYYYRAYAINSVGVKYTDNVMVSTQQKYDPIVSTEQSTGFEGATAVIPGIISIGSDYPPQTEMIDFGICWSTNQTPTISDSKTSTGNVSIPTNTNYRYLSSIGLLNPDTTYYYRAYATTVNGIFYGNVLSVKTDPLPEPNVETIAALNSIPNENWTLNGRLNNFYGGCTYGILLSSINSTPTIGQSGTTASTITGTVTSSVQNFSFVCNESSLTQNTIYYYRAYGYNNGGATCLYGDTKTFTTRIIP